VAKVAVLFGWPRCGTTTIGRILTVSGRARWDGEFLRQAGPPAATWERWLAEAQAWQHDEWVVGKVLPDHVAGFDVVAAAKAAGVTVAWAGRPSWDDVVHSMAAAAHRGAWVYPIRAFPPARGRLTPEQLREGGLRDAFTAAFPDAPRSCMSDFQPMPFIEQWLGLAGIPEPRPFIFSATEPVPPMPQGP
jgi:hypothetical protein